ncbi:hypothetical protein MLD38_032179 [Melastoma candidum]|uniref:Uncharacterized protein n=1 Tax=Melastoma candidum TaxID=119954 RepID=A0ACB9M6E2_9MYRT|nr:hypothetical protein MLD38_032179 [Melastoma candidum]
MTADQKPPILRQYFRKHRLDPPGRHPDPPPRDISGPTPANRSRRDVLNLLECHACGHRVDMSKGKDRLQTLYSEWRVVLLCRKCLVGVESAVTCSYCFEGCGGDEEGSFRCGRCRRRVHKQCFFRYRGIAPWSYSCNSVCEEFEVCIDCWVPRTVARFRKVGKRRGRKRKKTMIREGEVDGECMVVENGGCVKSGTLTDGMGGADVEVTKKKRKKKKVAREVVLREKPVVLAIGSRGELKKKRRNSFNMYREMCGNDSNEVDIIEERNVLVSLLGNNGDALARASALANNGVNEDFELSEKMNLGDMESSVEEKAFSQSLADESATENNAEPDSGKRIDDCGTKMNWRCKYVDVEPSLEGEGSCSNGMRSECQCCWKSDKRASRGDDEKNHLKTDRFAFKYHRRSLLPMNSIVKKSLLVYHRKLQTASFSPLPNAAPMQPFPSCGCSYKKPYVVYQRKLLIRPQQF